MHWLESLLLCTLLAAPPSGGDRFFLDLASRPILLADVSVRGPGETEAAEDSSASPRGGVVLVPAGEFLMGSPEAPGPRAERPSHKTYLDAFWIDRSEVTVAEYGACVKEGVCPKVEGGEEWECNSSLPGREDHPANCVDWFQAKTYCDWAGKRLPTEAEWEKAARGTDGRSYPWGNEAPSCQRAVMDEGGDGCGRGSTWPVGSKPLGASPCGALDMAGNVWEWVADWYGGDYYAASPAKNPPGPSTGTHRVLRGGAWNDDWPGDLRASFRSRLDPSSKGRVVVGFRCAKDGK